MDIFATINIGSAIVRMDETGVLSVKLNTYHTLDQLDQVMYIAHEIADSVKTGAKQCN